jgi:hypothetical protein
MKKWSWSSPGYYHCIFQTGLKAFTRDLRIGVLCPECQTHYISSTKIWMVTHIVILWSHSTLYNNHSWNCVVKYKSILGGLCPDKRGILGKQVVVMLNSRAGPAIHMCSAALNALSLKLYERSKHITRLKYFYLGNGSQRKHFEELFKMKVIAKSCYYYYYYYYYYCSTALCWSLAGFSVSWSTHWTYTQNKTNRINVHNTDIHVSSRIRTHDPSGRPSDDSSCLDRVATVIGK